MTSIKPNFVDRMIGQLGSQNKLHTIIKQSPILTHFSLTEDKVCVLKSCICKENWIFGKGGIF